MKQLAKHLSGGGTDVMTFDYYGTGDSGGVQVDATIPGWEEDILTAIEELKDITGVSKIAVIGLRLGATLAAAPLAHARPSPSAAAPR